MKENSQQILLSPFFLLGIFLLLLNDFALKSQFHNFFTGKLSDFAGLFVFPLFFVALFPKQKLLVYLSTAFLFLFWKSPYSQSLVDLWNSFQLFKIGRTIDYTDLFALSVLPLSYFYFKTEKQKTFSLSFAKRILASFVVLLSVFAFTATSYVEDRMAMIEGEYNFKLNKLDIESILKQNERVLNLKMERETDVFPANKYPDVKADQNVFFASFSVKQNICDSKFPEFHFIITQEKESSNVEAGFVYFKCKEESIKSDPSNAMNQFKQELSAIFEREVIEKLRQNDSQ